jgi:hypothetical protein
MDAETTTVLLPASAALQHSGWTEHRRLLFTSSPMPAVMIGHKLLLISNKYVHDHNCTSPLLQLQTPDCKFSSKRHGCYCTWIPGCNFQQCIHFMVADIYWQGKSNYRTNRCIISSTESMESRKEAKYTLFDSLALVLVHICIRWLHTTTCVPNLYDECWVNVCLCTSGFSSISFWLKKTFRIAERRTLLFAHACC